MSNQTRNPEKSGEESSVIDGSGSARNARLIRPAKRSDLFGGWGPRLL